MNLYVFSDSHSKCDVMKKIISENIHSCDYIIHLGDYTKDADSVERISGVVPFIKILGNGDYFNTDPYASHLKFLTLYGTKFMLCHGHKYGVKSGYDALFSAAELNLCDVVLFGHTHIPTHEKRGNITVFNPGSIGLPYGRKATYGIINIDENTIDLKICEVDL